MKYPKSTQKTVTLDIGLWYELGHWLDSDEAKQLGFHSKAQFVTEAVRELFLKYKNIVILKELSKLKPQEKSSDKKFNNAVRSYMRLMEEDTFGVNHQELASILQTFHDR